MELTFHGVSFYLMPSCSKEKWLESLTDNQLIALQQPDELDNMVTAASDSLEDDDEEEVPAANEEDDDEEDQNEVCNTFSIHLSSYFQQKLRQYIGGSRSGIARNGFDLADWHIAL